MSFKESKEALNALAIAIGLIADALKDGAKWTALVAAFGKIIANADVRAGLNDFRKIKDELSKPKASEVVRLIEAAAKEAAEELEARGQ